MRGTKLTPVFVGSCTESLQSVARVSGCASYKGLSMGYLPIVHCVEPTDPVQGYFVPQFVFVDETSKDNRTSRRTHAYGTRGEPVQVVLPAARGTRYSVLAAVSWLGGMLGYGMVEVCFA